MRSELVSGHDNPISIASWQHGCERRSYRNERDLRMRFSHELHVALLLAPCETSASLCILRHHVSGSSCAPITPAASVAMLESASDCPLLL